MFAGIIDERIADCAKYKDDPKKLLTIYADQKLCQIVQSVQPYKITRDLGAKMYEVQHERAKPGIGVRLVNWAEKTCSCLRMQLEGLPCVHLVCVYKQTCSKDKQTMVYLLGQLGAKIHDFYWIHDYYVEGYVQPVHLPALDYLVADDTIPPAKNREDRSLKRKKAWTERTGSARPKRALRQSQKLVEQFSLHSQMQADARQPERTTRSSNSGADGKIKRSNSLP
jgi:hypothetical protein